MDNKSGTEKQISKLTEFRPWSACPGSPGDLRQAIYQCGFTRRRDAQFELPWSACPGSPGDLRLDALLLKDQIASFPMLSKSSTAFTRRWHSIYAAMEKGQQDTTWLRSYLAKQAPETGIQFFSLDCTAWARPEAHTLPDRQYVYPQAKHD